MTEHKIAVFGGVYNNYLALEQTILDATHRGAQELYCLGDLGGFGPFPDNVFPLLLEHKIPVVQGNYDHSVGFNLKDCGCGYTDPRDNFYAQISYDYTVSKTSDKYKAWMRILPGQIRQTVENHKLLMVHGSPRKVNEFMWESGTSQAFLRKLFRDYEADIILCTHTGMKWHRQIDNKHFINVGAIGRPENDGYTNVWYALITIGKDVDVEFAPVTYDTERLAFEMQQEGLPEEFIETARTGWWTTCLEILPAKERMRGRY